ncbi:hypothetical protein [Cryptosporangium phraense]|uniref:Uncharacterized protein n=1 Tax=Cryptosporangium phraense TaxID=2593070 RepID=A0A545ADS2_9ACTN|nr:hypothetical protein [Cryptosporangium phraense]TQS39484.1 hypothetical protein FL583_39795 [Cryptosporangium phraense]
MSTMSLTLVGLSRITSLETCTAMAEVRVAATPLTLHGSTPHFLTTVREGRGLRAHSRQELTVGGPLDQLDLADMRQLAYQAYSYRWAIWNSVVAGTRPALPWWTFLQRHDSAPDRYPLARAQQDYLAQQQILLMTAYNALPHRALDLPTSHLEALQLGAQGYAHFGWLSAVPGDRMLCPDGTYLEGDDGRLSARLAYLSEANARIDALTEQHSLVALLTD